MRITNATLRGRAGTWDIPVEDGHFGSITASTSGPDVPAAVTDNETFDAAGRLVVEPFIDAHVHLDYACTAGRPRPNRSGTFVEAVQLWDERKRQGINTFDGLYQTGLAAARSEAACGTGFIRAQTDVTDPELTGLKAILQLRDDVKDWMEIQVVAFPQDTILSYPDCPGLLERALELGADVIGGIPHSEASREDGVASCKIIFDLARKYGVPVDAHCDEMDDDQSRFVEVMGSFAAKYELEAPVTATHAVAMAYYPDNYMMKLIPQLIAAGLNLAICPTENLQLQGRGMIPVPRGVAPIKRLADAGLNLAFGQDSMVDSFYASGQGNLLRVLDIGLHVGHMVTDDYLVRALDFITVHGAKNLGISDRYGIEEGKPANLIVLDCSSDKEAVQYQPDVLFSMHNGRTVFARQPATYTETMAGFTEGST